MTGRDQVVAFLRRKWTRELDYRLTQELRAYRENRIAVRFAYEYRDGSSNWFRAYGIENWEFNDEGLMCARRASINDAAHHGERARVSLALVRRPDDQPGLSALGM